MEQRSLAFVTDDELLRRLIEILGRSRRVEADLIEHVAEVDARRLYLREASPSMFAYCTEVLHLSEAEAYARITVARASRRHPALLHLLREGRLHLTGIALLAPYLTAENEARLLARAEHKTRRQIEELVAEVAPRPDAPSFIRQVPASAGACLSPVGAGERLDPLWGGPVPGGADEAMSHQAASPGSPGLAVTAMPHEPSVVAVGERIRSDAPAARSIEALALGRYKVQFMASGELREKLERLRSLLRPQVPDGDLAALIERAVTEAIDRLESRRFGKTVRRRATPMPELVQRTRHVPAAVRRVVAELNGLQCGFVGKNGRRCTERGDLEFHHRHPWAMGGSHDPGNVGLLCRAHNGWLADHDYGRRAIRRTERDPDQAGRGDAIALRRSPGVSIHPVDGQPRNASPTPARPAGAAGSSRDERLWAEPPLRPTAASGGG
jgi:hypothetical protein